MSLHKWLYAMYLVVTARKGISSLQLSKQIGVTQKTAWFMLGRIREACGDDIDKLHGTVEVDEAYIGGKERNKHASMKPKAGCGPVGERGGKSVAMPVSSTTKNKLQSKIAEHAERGPKVCTDEFSSYKGLNGYEHGHVKHSAGEDVGANDIHINGVESMWAVFKRSLYGTWHHCSRKHLARYLNQGGVKNHTLLGLKALALKALCHRITYREAAA